MPKIVSRITRMSLSELRGIVLVILGSLALGFYYSWWFQEGRLAGWLAVGLILALLYTSVQILGNWIVYLATHHRPQTPPLPAKDFTVDIFVTACKENYALVERTLTAACAIKGNQKTWLLDDGNDPQLAALAKDLGAGYLTRTDRKDAKAGNVNAALARTQGDIMVIFDIDHVPSPDFLKYTLEPFNDPKIGFVQVMPTFSNIDESWIARASAETSLEFYNPTSKGMDGLSSVTKMGSNALIRRAALESINGYQPGLAEDLATSVAIHAAGWRSSYVAEPLAPGLATPDLTAWFTQQLKWARGVFELLLTDYPRLFSRLNWGQRLSYAIRMTKYWVGPAICIHLLLTLTVLLAGSDQARADFEQYLLYLFPLVFGDMMIRQLALRRWRHPSVFAGAMWRAVILVYSTWPIYTLAWLMALLRLPLAFRPTPKSSSGSLNPFWLLPQLATTALLLIGLLYSIFIWQGPIYWLSLGFAGSQALIQTLFLARCGITLLQDNSNSKPGGVRQGLGSLKRLYKYLS